jgi:hypothetical protein
MILPVLGATVGKGIGLDKQVQYTQSFSRFHLSHQFLLQHEQQPILVSRSIQFCLLCMIKLRHSGKRIIEDLLQVTSMSVSQYRRRRARRGKDSSEFHQRLIEDGRTYNYSQFFLKPRYVISPQSSRLAVLNRVSDLKAISKFDCPFNGRT